MFRIIRNTSLQLALKPPELVAIAQDKAGTIHLQQKILKHFQESLELPQKVLSRSEGDRHH